MRYETLEEYNKELDEMEKSLAEMEEYLEKHPEKFGTRGNYETYKYVYNIFKNEKVEFLKEINEINLHLKGSSLINELTLNNFDNLQKRFNDVENSTGKLLEKTGNLNEKLKMTSITEGSYKITFAFENPNDEDLLRKSPRKKGLLKLIDLINCGDDIEKLKIQAGKNGKETLIAYKKFLEEIIKFHADFTLDTEKGNIRTALILQQSKNICENLNI